MTHGSILEQTGMLISNDLLQLVHLKLKRGECVPAHDHKGQEVFFTLVAGQVEVSLDNEETHTLQVGKVLHFAGEVSVGVRALQDSEFFVYLINRNK